MARRTERLIRSEADLIAADDAIDRLVCGRSLLARNETRLADQGAHDPTPTPYFVLQQLFEHFTFTERTHLLDVGCATGRVLAHFLRERYPGTATGVELDSELAAVARSWTAMHENLSVIEASVLDIDLSPYTDFYLFNPFDNRVLRAFIDAVETQVRHPCTIIHMSDNGDSWWYQNRPGWSKLASGSFQHYRNARGFPVAIYENPQHYTVWHFDPAVQ